MKIGFGRDATCALFVGDQNIPINSSHFYICPESVAQQTDLESCAIRSSHQKPAPTAQNYTHSYTNKCTYTSLQCRGDTGIGNTGQSIIVHTNSERPNTISVRWKQEASGLSQRLSNP